MSAPPADEAEHGTALQAYLLGSVDFEAALRFQRRMHYEVSGNRDLGVLILCEHPPLISVGRHGSRAHILCEADELRAREWRIRWVNRGGGCMLHLPGQLAMYSIVALDRLGLTLPEYIARLQGVLQDVLDDFSVAAEVWRHPPGVSVGSRVIAGVGVSVRDWVSYYGAFLNINPDLPSYRLVRWGHGEEAPMTSLVRERRAPLRPALVRERLIEHFASRFAFSRTTLFSDHPMLKSEKARASEHVA
jgi:lipoyl(octanoyl) transferase